ncbi:MAG: hypothetical protein ACPKM0_09215 [Pleomorphochaeta sp.]
MGKNIWVTIPTFWGKNEINSLENQIIFDHPTYPSSRETLSRTINSLNNINGKFNVLIILAITHKKYYNEAKSKVVTIINKLNIRNNIFLVSEDEINLISKQLHTNLLNLNSYGSVRNIQLFIPYCLGCDYVIAIDDDEIIENKDFIKDVVTSLDNEDKACGLAGPYLDKNGNYEIKNADKLNQETNLYKRKIYYMNEAVKKEMNHKDDFHPSVIAFGGNMCFKRSTIKNIPHDPFIPRGEDYDYVLNAYLFDFQFYFNKNTHIIHLPPSAEASSDKSNLNKLKADIVRFIYMNKKINEYNKRFGYKKMDNNLFYPYPGNYFIKEELLINDVKEILSIVFENNKNKIDDYINAALSTCEIKCSEYFKFKENWNSLLNDCNKINLVKQIFSETKY